MRTNRSGAMGFRETEWCERWLRKGLRKGVSSYASTKVTPRVTPQRMNSSRESGVSSSAAWWARDVKRVNAWAGSWPLSAMSQATQC